MWVSVLAAVMVVIGLNTSCTISLANQHSTGSFSTEDSEEAHDVQSIDPIEKEARVFLGGTLTTLFMYTFSTTTVATAFYTCASAISTSTQCTGRRKRRATNIRLKEVSDLLPNITNIDNLLAPSTKSKRIEKENSETPSLKRDSTSHLASLGNIFQPRNRIFSQPMPAQRLGGITVTSFTSTTYIISTTTTNNATTVSLSIQCTLSGGSSVFPAC